MSTVLFFLQVIIISLAIVISPGPITTATIGHGVRSPYAGFLIALGHGCIEIPLIIALFLGLGKLLNSPALKIPVFIFGGVFLFFMGLGMVRSTPDDLKKEAEKPSYKKRESTIVGAMMSLLNPYFFIWWGTVGLALITRSAEIGLWAFILFIFLHWSCDALWYLFLSALSYKGSALLGKSFQHRAVQVCGVCLIIFSLMFLWDAARPFLQAA
jgi:threonine/homoserine/homoserine lactone efflux protein